jgi:hypothetical protein
MTRRRAGRLDRRLANGQAMIRGSHMILKLEQPERGRIIRYLEAYSPYDGSLV